MENIVVGPDRWGVKSDAFLERESPGKSIN